MLKFLSKKIKYIASECSWKNVLNLDTLLKIIFIYSVSVLVIILCYFDFSSGAFSDNGKKKIAIYSNLSRIGEHQTYLKSLKSLENLDIEYVGCSLNESLANYIIAKPFYKGAIYIVHKLTKPQYSIAVTHLTGIVPPGVNFVYLNVPDLMLFGKGGKFISKHKHLKEFDGYIDLFSFVNGRNPDLKEVLRNEGKENAPIIPAYLAQGKRDLLLPKSYEKAVITGSLWGANRSSYRLISSLKKLAEENLLIAYGLEDQFKFLGDAYKGKLEKYGDPVRKVLELQREAGISLIFHNFEHLIQGLPTSRISEGVMSGSAIISDHHPFVMKYFKNNVLYFNSFGSSEEIYNQIKNHIKWVKNNPERVKEMARKNHEIFTNELTLEIQLPKVIKAIEDHLNAKI